MEELRSELESLKEELSSAKTQAEMREHDPPPRSRRGIVLAAGAVTVGAGVAVGLIVGESGGHSRLAAPITGPASTAFPPTTVPTEPSSTRAPVTQPRTTQPPTTQPGSPAGGPPPSRPGSPAAGLTLVQPGQSFWTIAVSTEQERLGRAPTPREVAGYWVSLVDANLPRLVRPGDPDLLYAGQALLLPPM